MLIQLNDSLDAIDSDGRYTPCAVNVLPYYGEFVEPGDIFDRYYLTTQEIRVGKLSPFSFADDAAFMDNAVVLKSVKVNPKSDSITAINDIKRVLNVIGDASSKVPQTLRE